MSFSRKRRFEKFGRDKDFESSSSSDEEVGPSRGDGVTSRVSDNKLKPRKQESTTKRGDPMKKHDVPRKSKEDSPDSKVHIIKHSKEVAGPALPPNLCALTNESGRNISSPSTEGVLGGPNLPPHLRNISHDNGLLHEVELSRKVIGPTLPPHLSACAPSSSIEDSQEETPPSSVVGPTLPPHLCTASKKLSEEQAADVIGPALPPHLVHLLPTSPTPTSSEKDSSQIAGPALPPHLSEVVRQGKVVGPQLPPGFIPPADDSSEEEEGSFGPDPRLMASGESSKDLDVDERAERARRKMLGLDKVKVERESWMLDLPPERSASLGLGPRQFRAKLAPEMGDRSVWTDTPTDTARKESLPPKIDEKAMLKKQLIAERDREMEKMARKAEKKLKRKESLLASHTKKLKKEAKKEAKSKEGEPVERKRFSREEDMQVNRFDEAQKKAIFKKAQFLNDRFSQGESKYL